MKSRPGKLWTSHSYPARSRRRPRRRRQIETWLRSRPQWKHLEALEPRIMLTAEAAIQGTALEANESVGLATATVTLSEAAGPGGVDVNYIVGGDADADVDYVELTSPLHIPEGQTSATLDVTPYADNVFEGLETVVITLDAGSYTIDPANDDVTLSIIDDDPAPTLSIEDVFVYEGDSGSSTAFVRTRLSGRTDQTVTVNYDTADDSALSPSDFAAASGTLTFDLLITIRTIEVDIVGDTDDTESNERFLINLTTPQKALLNDPQGIVTILNDNATARISGNDSVKEGSEYTLTLDGSGLGTITQWEIDWGDGGGVETVGDVTSATHTYADGYNRHQITATADDGAQHVSNTLTVEVENVAPLLTIAGDPSVEAGTPYQLNLFSQDPGTDTISQWEIDWGDGTTQTVAGNPPFMIHTYGAGGVEAPIIASAMDEDGRFYAEAPAGSFIVDPTFADNGQARTDIFGFRGWGTGVDVQEDGSIVMVGGAETIASTQNNHLAWMAYTKDGEPDRHFGDAGVVTVDLVGNREDFEAVALEPDGQIVAVGDRSVRRNLAAC